MISFNEFSFIGVARKIGLPAFIAASGSRDVMQNAASQSLRSRCHSDCLLIAAAIRFSAQF